MSAIGVTETLDLEVVRGCSGVFFLTVTESDGETPQNLTGSTLEFNAAPDGVVIQLTSPSGGIVVTNAAGGLATMTIPPADSTPIVNTGIYQGPCELVLVNGSSRYLLNRGTLTVLPNVS